MKDKATIILLLSAVLLYGCLDDDANPLSAREEQLIGLWRLDIAAVDDDDFEFSYEFERNKRVTHRIGGAFLEALRDRPELADVNFGELSNLDGGTVRLRGEWALAADTLDVVFDSIDVSVFGPVPFVGRRSLPVYSADLPEDGDYEITYACGITDTELTLAGESLTVGVPLDQAAEEQLPPEGLGPVGTEAIRMVGEFLLQIIRQEDLNQVTLTRAR